MNWGLSVNFCGGGIIVVAAAAVSVSVVVSLDEKSAASDGMMGMKSELGDDNVV